MDFHTYKKLRIEYPKLTSQELFELNEDTDNETEKETDNRTTQERDNKGY